jgi:hypothetical protein
MQNYAQEVLSDAKISLREENATWYLDGCQDQYAVPPTRYAAPYIFSFVLLYGFW